MDVLDDILGSLRLTGGVVVDGEFSGDFCVQRASSRRAISSPSSRCPKS